MRIHPKGIVPILIITMLVLGILAVINAIFPYQSIVHYILYSIGFLFLVAVVLFFRRPARVVNANEDHVLSAADGTVVVIEEVFEKSYFNDRRIQVSVFMSPLNVHVNWYPISGDIVHSRYFKGHYHPAYLPKASEENERQTVVIRNEDGTEVMMVQIAGIMARRVFSNARIGNYVFQGEECGIIKFGSRVDVFLPVDAKVRVKLMQQVTACQDVIAELNV